MEKILTEAERQAQVANGVAYLILMYKQSTFEPERLHYAYILMQFGIIMEELDGN